jgi:HEAT repeat protein
VTGSLQGTFVDDDIDLSELIVDLNSLDKQAHEAAYMRLLDLGQEAVPHLVDMFPRIAGRARLMVVRALGELGHPAASPLLVGLVLSRDPNEYVFVASLAVRSLGQIGDVDALLDLLQAERPGPRRMAATVLRNIGDPRAVPGLIAALDDPDAHVCRVSAEALEGIDTPAARAAVEAWRAG